MHSAPTVWLIPTDRHISKYHDTVKMSRRIQREKHLRNHRLRGFAILWQFSDTPMEAPHPLRKRGATLLETGERLRLTVELKEPFFRGCSTGTVFRYLRLTYEAGGEGYVLQQTHILSRHQRSRPFYYIAREQGMDISGWYRKA